MNGCIKIIGFIITLLVFLTMAAISVVFFNDAWYITALVLAIIGSLIAGIAIGIHEHIKYKKKK